jgi:tetratricopeptide (TPR) repeat protein
MADREFEKGIKFFNIKRWDMALQAFQATDTENFGEEEKLGLAYYLGLCYTKLERYNDALLYLEQVVTSNGDPLRVCQCRMTLAYIYMITKRTKMAEFELDRLLKAGFQAAQIYTMSAYSAWAQKDYKRAVEMYEKALEIDVNNAGAMNGLGYVLVDTNIDARRGLEFCKRAVENKPQSAAYLDSLGWAYYRTGEMKEAKNWMRRALDLAPRQSEIRRHMRAIIGEAS